jgi:hypothetical protein
LRTLQAPAKNLILIIFNLSSPEIPRRHEPHYLIKCKATHGKAEIGYLAFWKLEAGYEIGSPSLLYSSLEITNMPPKLQNTKTHQNKNRRFSLMCSNVVQKSDEAMMR